MSIELYHKHGRLAFHTTTRFNIQFTYYQSMVHYCQIKDLGEKSPRHNLPPPLSHFVVWFIRPIALCKATSTVIISCVILQQSEANSIRQLGEAWRTSSMLGKIQSYSSYQDHHPRLYVMIQVILVKQFASKMARVITRWRSVSSHGQSQTSCSRIPGLPH